MNVLASNDNVDPMLDAYIFETVELLDQLEQHILSSEKDGNFDSSMNEIFRIMHTIKGNSAMMLFDNISTLAHSVEDLFDYLRQQKPKVIDYSKITDIILESMDFVKVEVEKIQRGEKADGDSSGKIEYIKDYLKEIKKNNEDVAVHENTKKQLKQLKK